MSVFPILSRLPGRVQQATSLVDVGPNDIILPAPSASNRQSRVAWGLPGRLVGVDVRNTQLAAFGLGDQPARGHQIRLPHQDLNRTQSAE